MNLIEIREEIENNPNFLKQIKKDLPDLFATNLLEIKNTLYNIDKNAYLLSDVVNQGNSYYLNLCVKNDIGTYRFMTLTPNIKVHENYTREQKIEYTKQKVEDLCLSLSDGRVLKNIKINLLDGKTGFELDNATKTEREESKYEDLNKIIPGLNDGLWKIVESNLREKCNNPNYLRKLDTYQTQTSESSYRDELLLSAITKLHDANSELNDANCMIVSLKESIKYLAAENERLEAENKKLQAENEQLKDTIKDKDADIKHKQSTIDDLVANICRRR